MNPYVLTKVFGNVGNLFMLNGWQIQDRTYNLNLGLVNTSYLTSGIQYVTDTINAGVNAIVSQNIKQLPTYTAVPTSYNLEKMRSVAEQDGNNCCYGITCQGIVKIPYDLRALLWQSRIDALSFPAPKSYSNAEILLMNGIDCIQLYYRLNTFHHKVAAQAGTGCNVLIRQPESVGLSGLQWYPGIGNYDTEGYGDSQIVQNLLQQQIYYLRTDLHKIPDTNGKIVDGIINLNGIDLRQPCAKDTGSLAASIFTGLVQGVIALSGVGLAATAVSTISDVIKIVAQVNDAQEAQTQILNYIKTVTSAANTLSQTIVGLQGISPDELNNVFGTFWNPLPLAQAQQVPTSVLALTLAKVLQLPSPAMIASNPTTPAQQETLLIQAVSNLAVSRQLERQKELVNLAKMQKLFCLPWVYPETGIVDPMIILHKNDVTGILETLPLNVLKKSDINSETNLGPAGSNPLKLYQPFNFMVAGSAKYVFTTKPVTLGTLVPALQSLESPTLDNKSYPCLGISYAPLAGIYSPLKGYSTLPLQTCSYGADTDVPLPNPAYPSPFEVQLYDSTRQQKFNLGVGSQTVAVIKQIAQAAQAVPLYQSLQTDVPFSLFFAAFTAGKNVADFVNAWNNAKLAYTGLKNKFSVATSPIGQIYKGIFATIKLTDWFNAYLQGQNAVDAFLKSNKINSDYNTIT